jgi:hypothetical protein
VELRGVSGLSVNLDQARSIPQGTYSVYVDAYDTVSAPGEALAPYRITCILNGALADELKFEFITAANGTRVVSRSELVPAARVYRYPPGYEAGSIRLPRGQAALTVEVRDIAENSRSVTYRFNVE